MKAQEAIELLDNLVGMIEDNHNNDYDKAFKMGIEALRKEAINEQIMWERNIALSQLEEIGVGLGAKMDVVKEAMEKQNPKFVECKEWKGIRNTRYKCPICKKFVRNDESYCHKCGQAIKFPGVKQNDGKLELYWGD